MGYRVKCLAGYGHAGESPQGDHAYLGHGRVAVESDTRVGGSDLPDNTYNSLHEGLKDSVKPVTDWC
ncbi:hypothetical protein ES703_106819 [subsurface metagenome]